MNKKTAFFALQKSLRKTALQTINKFLKAQWKYLDDLIEVFLSIKNRNINVDEQLFKHYHFPVNSFTNLSEAYKEDCTHFIITLCKTDVRFQID